MTTTVIHIRHKTGADNEVYIGRGSKWGNPYVIVNVTAIFIKILDEWINRGEG